jgi:hypothetical protein
MGMLSLERIIAPQRGQCERGWTMDSWRGRREMQTLRKLPKAKAEDGGEDAGEDADDQDQWVAPVQL